MIEETFHQLEAHMLRKLGYTLMMFATLLSAPTAVLAHAHGNILEEGHYRARSNATRRSWVCNAYGRESMRGTWQTVTGARMPTEKAAKLSAQKECSSRRTGCQPSGCWPD